MIEYGEGDEHLFLARDFSRMRDYSESTAQAIDAEVKMLIDEAYARATKLLTEKRAQLDLIAKALLEWETLEGTPPPAKAEEEKKTDGPLPDGLTPVPA